MEIRRIPDGVTDDELETATIHILNGEDSNRCTSRSRSMS